MPAKKRARTPVFTDIASEPAMAKELGMDADTLKNWHLQRGLYAFKIGKQTILQPSSHCKIHSQIGTSLLGGLTPKATGHCISSSP